MKIKTFAVDDIVQINSNSNTNHPGKTKTTVVLISVDNKNQSFMCDTISFSGYDAATDEPWAFSWAGDSGFYVFKVGTKLNNPEYFL